MFTEAQKKHILKQLQTRTKYEEVAQVYLDLTKEEYKVLCELLQPESKGE